MFSKEESKRIRQEFWTAFGKEHPRKWLLYNTRIKDVQLKFSFDNEKAEVSIDFTSSDELMRDYYFEKLESLKTILLEEYLPDAVYEETYPLPEGKIISRVYTRLNKVNIHNRKDWPPVMDFLEDRMDALERFFLEYADFIAD
ncbi:DUF4268 domain-containing protein [Antarcticibacterium flavum]|uniref:DUF4268 domain-containing protein n=1 Tax=Antarcticibacterium flavum TaxID=2058175 RepID=A0A5B7WYT8_9FLAO|nr:MULTISPECIES: DUF4268 domain-containing protein [Antarcticibacterium]MCM4161887.1 DUF4268 domain-containing protein [Antarcticibacterium sp. W02-3]QCY68346.1 DUF4268 domain-containing protein [Antarcticibacterium flavum]